MPKKFLFLLLLACPHFGFTSAHAGDLSWSGLYRVEYFQSENLELDGVKRRDGYFLHHLIMDPKFIAGDGLTIYSRFDVLNNCQFGQGSQAGEFLGSGITNSSYCTGATANSTTPAPANGKTNVFSSSESPGTIQVNELYLSWVHEFGVFVVGRVPLQFGLGVTYNAGQGQFDHWLTNEDLVGYKLVFGNLFVMPMIGKVNQGSNSGQGNFDIGGGVTDYLLHVQYDNPETDLSLGIFGGLRVAGPYGDDTPLGNNGVGGAGATTSGGYGYKSESVNLFVKQKFNDLSVGVEGAFQTGNNGATINNATKSQGAMNSFGIAGELGYTPKASSWVHTLKAGIASGDNPGTSDNYEGFTFNRNYNVALLMFNHPLGANNFFRTQTIRDTTTNASNNIDNEAISNAFYIAPSTDYKLRDNLSFGATILFASLLQDPFLLPDGTASGTSKNLGFEGDLRVTYKPYERFTWLTEVGLLFPGSAWQGGAMPNSSGGTGYGNSFAYGLSTKAAISF